MVFTRSALSSGSTNVYTTPVASKSTSSKKTPPCVHAVNERSTRKPRVCYRKFFEDDQEDDDEDVVDSHNSTPSKSSPSTAPATRSIFTRSAKEAALRKYKIYSPKLKVTSFSSTKPIVQQENHVVKNSLDEGARQLQQLLMTRVDNSSSTVMEKLQYSFKDITRNYPKDEEESDEGEIYAGIEGRFHSFITKEDSDEVNDDVYDAANTLTNLNQSNEYPTYETTERCINPVTPCVRYVYRFKATCPDRKQHYMSSYVIYDERTRRYHLLNKHTLLAPDQSSPYAVNGYIESSFQTKYVSYLRDTVEKYIMNVLVHRSIPHVVTCEFIGLVMNDADYQRLFDVDSCFYDIDRIFTIQNSRQTTSGHEMFILTPEACYSETTFEGLQVQDALAILAGQH